MDLSSGGEVVIDTTDVIGTGQFGTKIFGGMYEGKMECAIKVFVFFERRMIISHWV